MILPRLAARLRPAGIDALPHLGELVRVKLARPAVLDDLVFPLLELTAHRSHLGGNFVRDRDNAMLVSSNQITWTGP